MAKNEAPRKSDESGEANERVPLFGTWRNAYIVIVVAFVIQVAIFCAFSRYFS